MPVNGKRKNNSGQGFQMNLWDQLAMNAGPVIKAAMSEAIKRSSMSREEIVDEMNRIALAAGITCNGRCQKVSGAVLDKWVAPGAAAHQIPLRLLPVFCSAVRSNLPLEAYSRCFAGAKVVSEEDYRILEWARLEIASRQSKKRARRLAQEVGIE
jgi:hypothetical protein